MTYLAAFLLVVLALSASILLIGLANTRRSSARPKPIVALTEERGATPAGLRRTGATPLPLPRPPPLTEESLPLGKVERTFPSPHRLRFESRFGEPGRG